MSSRQEKKILTFKEWFSRRSGGRDHMTVSPRVRVLPCGCGVHKHPVPNGQGSLQGTIIYKQSDGSWAHNCVVIKKTTTVIVPKDEWEADPRGY